MAKKPPNDPNKAAKSVLDTIIEKQEKNAAAVALGKLGASKGGKARAAVLTKVERSEIAKKGAEARWKKK